ncbi:acyltransferase [Alsobacter soli]|uniref:Acyltransferase n=1 Tax=Alsobacter soli TaxID=2109933 RepID=A0A2T1HQF6_9HYPH|nr:acyltransferase family protein [Alsobacter soli]PSC03866.1 acyltransferase [Alsobacter soli]
MDAIAADSSTLRARPASPAPAGAKRHVWRPDIQALRGWAVLIVVIQHAGARWLPGGFLGVDIFFVISGFLMGGIILRELEEGRFSFANFYARRVRRLLPAAYATVLVTAVLAVLLLDPFEFQNFLAQELGAFTFTINYVLWRQVDYFNSDAVLKPLLHMWSLSLEEQFYIVAPVVLWLCPRRFRIWLVAALVLASFALCVVFVQRSPAAAFYFLPTRAWELGVGMLAYAWAKPGLASRLRQVTQAVCAAFLFAAPWVFNDHGHPGMPALAVCLATAAMLVVGGAQPLPAPARPLGWLGDRSYSLYLVHWPLLSLVANVFVEPPPGWVNALVLVACLACMELQYRFVEQRFRTMKVSRAALAGLAAIPVLALVPQVALTRFADGFQNVRAANEGFGEDCAYGSSFTDMPECRSGPKAHVLVWGDSFAMHLVPGLDATVEGGVVQASRPVCGPFLGIAPVDGVQYKRDWALSCIAFNASVLDYLKSRPEIDTVVLSSILRPYLPGADKTPWRMLVQGDAGDDRTAPPDAALLRDALARTVAGIRAAGKKVVLVAPPPSSGADLGRCADRLRSGKPTVAPGEGCSFPRTVYEANRAPILSFLADVRASGTVDVIDFDQALCGDGRCRAVEDGVALYQDSGHLSSQGSVLLARAVGLDSQIRMRAR